MYSVRFSRWLSVLLVLSTLLGLLVFPAAAEEPPAAETLAGAGTVTLKYNSTGLRLLNKSTGGTYGGGCYTYTANTGLQGPGYCVNYDLTGVSSSKQLPIHKYDRNPKTMGAITNGYPQRTLEQFKELHPDDIRGIDALTLDEYAYATQVAVWASCGQIAVPGTAFTAGRSSIVEPTADAQQIRVFDSVKAILKLADGWTKHLHSGVYLRAGENENIPGVEVIHEEGLSGAAREGTDGIKKETINGTEYYTRVLYVSSATSTWISGHKMDVYSTDAPSGTIFVAENNSPLETGTASGVTSYKVDTSTSRTTTFNANGRENYGPFKVCIPVSAAAEEGSFTIKTSGQVAQFQLYLAENSSSFEQSYIIADPAYVTLSNQMPFKWNKTENVPQTASLQIVKAGSGGEPLEGAEFTLAGSGGTTVNGTSDRNGQVVWNDLPAGEAYTLTETKAPEGYTIVDPINITLTAGRTAYVTVNDSTERRFTIKKVDTQNKASIQGAVFRFEQIDGSFVTTGTTDFDGTIEFLGDELPYGCYRVTEQSPAEGYVKSDRVETVDWDGKKDVTITWENDRDPTIIIEKVDEQTGVSLPGAAFDVYADGKLITSVITNNAGEARISGIKKEAYIEVVETAAPAGYALDPTPHGIHIDPYDPTLEDDPVLTVTNRAKPALRILKYDQQSKSPMPNVTFQIYRDSQLIGQYTTGANGDIFLYDLPAGTYLVEEIATDDAHVVNSTPQQIKLENGAAQTYELVFFNSRKPGIRLIKVDSQTMASLPNAKFEFKLVGGSFTKEFTTGIDGLIDLTKLEPGAYEVRETAAPDGYLIDDAVRIVQVDPDEDASFVFTNTRKPKIRLVKKSSDGSPLQGVFFDIKRIEDGTVYENQITDERGEINIPDLEPGVYSVRETATTSNHILDLHEYHVELFPGQTSTISLENQRRPSLIIRKTDKDSGAPIPGVTFTLEGPDGPTITTEPTGPDGTVTVENLLPGVYTVKEQNVPEGYLLDTTPQRITLFPNRTGTVQFQNYKRPTLKIAKVDINGKPLTGAIFEVKTKAGVKIGDFPVGADGTITVSNIHLTEGYYIVTEKQAPEWYILDKTPHEVYLRPGKTTEISIENEKKPGLTIYKVDSITGGPVKGAKFEIYVSKDKTEHGTYQKLDSTFYYSDENGIIHLDGLDTGWYKVVEVEPADGFTIKEPAEQILYVEHDKAAEITFENTPLNGIVVEKYDNVTHAALPGCTFQLRYLSGTSGTGGTVIGQKVTGKNGTALWTGLKPGAYVVEEVDPAEGYSIINSSETVYIADNGEQSVITVRFSNSPDGNLLIRKVCSVNPSVTLQNAEFKVTYADGTIIGDSNGIYRTDEAGEIRITGLTPGKSVVVTETKAPAGFLIDTQSQTVQIKEGRTVSLTFKNQPKGGIIVQKRDSATGQPLPGAEFRVTTAAGCEVGLNGVIGTSTLTQNGLFKTDSSGEIRISNLAPGAYVLTETKAPAGYVMDTPSTNVVIGANGDTQTVVITNTRKGGLIVEKYDSVTKQPLSGAQFKITTASGELVPDNEGMTSSNGLYTTNVSGQIVLSKLLPGTYVVTEMKAPANYQADPKSQTVVVNAGDTQTLRFYNAPLCTLTILKRDAVTKKPLQGAEFTVKDSEGKVIGPNNGRYITGTDGTVTISGLTPNATIVVSESKAPKGYILDQTPKNIVVRTGVANSLTFDDEPGTTLIIRKFIEGTENEPLSGVAFKVVDGSGAAVGPDDGTYYTDKAGEIVLNGLEPGTTVIAREIKTVDGFILDGTPQDILIKAGEVQQLTFWNKRAGTLLIEKLDSITKAPLAGAQFKVLYADGRVVDTEGGKLSSNGIYTTDQNGQIKITQVTGTLVVTEEKAPDGYVMDPNGKSQTVVVNPQDTQTLRLYNEPLCSLTLTKVDSVSGKPVPNTQFTVKDGNGNVIGQYTTGKDGTVTVTGLIPGSAYVVTETRVPSGYVLNTMPQTIVVRNGANALGGGAVNSGIVNGGALGTTGTTGNTGTTANGGSGLTFENDPKMTLTIRKYIEGTDNEPLSGVQFKVTDGSGAPVGGGDGIFRTDNTGSIVIEGLEPGTTVTAQEVKTVEGYVLDGTPKSVKIKAGEKAPELVFWNQKAGELVIRKLDKLTGKPLAGVEFELTYADGGYVDNANGHLSSKGLYTTDAKGEIRISGVTGTIVVKETKTISGYTIDPSTQSQTVTVNPADTQTLTFYNTPGTTLTIQKYIDGTTDPIQGVSFLVTDSSGAVLGPNNGEYVTDENGRIVINDLVPGVTITAKETRTADGYVLDSTPKSILIKEGEGQTLTFYNKAEGGLELIKVSASDKSKRIPNTTFEIRKMDGALIDTVTTDKNGRVHVPLDAGDYYALETEAGDGFKIDTTPQYFTIKDGQTTTLTVTNEAFSGVIIHKIDSVSGDGIYGVKFLVYDQNKNPVGEYTTDDQGYIYIDDLTVQGKGKLFIRELEAATGYELDKQYKTVYVQPGKTIEIEWENTPITGQIQVMKHAAEYNEVTGTPAGAPLQGAVYEISDPRSNKVVDYITTDARGVAASKPLPLGRYKIVEVTAPAYWQLDPTVFDETLEYSGQIIKVSAYDKASNLGVTITKRGNAETLAGSPMRYDFTVANTSNVALDNFYWHDRIPTDAAAATVLTTGTYRGRLNYRILYKTNQTADYQVLASNLITSSSYSFSLNAIPTQAGEVVTDIYFDFGKVPVGFQSISNPTLTVVVSGNAANGYQLVNRADVGGKYQGTWQTGQATWVTLIRKLVPTVPLPKTGY